MLNDEYDVETEATIAAVLERGVGDAAVVVVDADCADRPLEAVTAELEGEDCQVVVITAAESVTGVGDSESVGVLQKPVSKPELVTTIDQLADRSQYDGQESFFALQRGESEERQPTTCEQASNELSDELGRREETLDKLIESSPAAIVTLDEIGTVDIWNPNAERLFGWRYEEVAGEEPPIFPRSAASEMAEIREAIAENSLIQDVDVECLTALGTTVDVSLSATPLYDDRGQPVGSMFVMMDITQRQQREQRLSVLSRILRHNIRNELTVVMGRCEILRETIDGEHADHLDPVIESVNDLLRLCRKAQSVQEALEDVPENVDVKDLEPVVESVIDDATEIFEGVTVSRSIQIADTSVLAGEGLEMAVWQLVENAIEYNESETPVVHLTVDSETTTTGVWTRLCVADNGPGIPEIEVETIEREKEDALTHSSGIGLWSVKWLVQQSGGTISFDESDMGGTLVTIRLPQGQQAHTD